LSEKKPSIIQEQQALLRAKTEALTGKKLRLAGLLPPQRFGQSPVCKPPRIPLWPLLLLLPLLLLPLRHQSEPKSPPPPLNISVPQPVFPAEITVFYQHSLQEEATLCQRLLEKAGGKARLEPLTSPHGEACLYLLSGAAAAKWQAEGLLEPIPLSVLPLPVTARVYPSLWGPFLTGTQTAALPLTVAVPFLFVQKRAWAQAGLAQRQIPKSWEEVLELLPRLRRFDPDGQDEKHAFWPFQESPLLWAFQLDRLLGRSSVQTAVAWLGQLIYRQGLDPAFNNKDSVMLVAKRHDALEEYYPALPPTPDGNPSPLLADVSYLAVPKGASKLAARLAETYLRLDWHFPAGALLPPILGETAAANLNALSRAMPLSIAQERQQELTLSIYKALQGTGKEPQSAGN
jgi:hypothetical protein